MNADQIREHFAASSLVTLAADAERKPFPWKVAMFVAVCWMAPAAFFWFPWSEAGPVLAVGAVPFVVLALGRLSLYGWLNAIELTCIAGREFAVSTRNQQQRTAKALSSRAVRQMEAA